MEQLEKELQQLRLEIETAPKQLMEKTAEFQGKVQTKPWKWIGLALLVGAVAALILIGMLSSKGTIL